MGVSILLSAVLVSAVTCGIFLRYMRHIPGSLWALSGFSVVLLMVITTGTGAFLTAVSSMLLKDHGLYGWLIFVAVLVCVEDGLRIFFCRALRRKSRASLNDVALAFGLWFATVESVVLYYAVSVTDTSTLMSGAEGLSGWGFGLVIVLGMAIIAAVRIAAHYLLCRFETLAFEKRFVLLIPLAGLHVAMNFSGAIATLHFSGSFLALVSMLPIAALVVGLMYLYGTRVVMPFKYPARLRGT